MSKGHKQRWIAAGLLVLVTGTGALVLRERRAEQAMRLRGADGCNHSGAWRPGAASRRGRGRHI